MPYIIAEPCINLKDRSCVDVCPVDCIYEGEDQLYIHPDECIDCGACEPECPVTAIFPEEDTPPQWKSYIAKNRDVFQGASPPGSRSARDPKSPGPLCRRLAASRPRGTASVAAGDRARAWSRARRRRPPLRARPRGSAPGPPRRSRPRAPAVRSSGAARHTTDRKSTRLN